MVSRVRSVMDPTMAEWRWAASRGDCSAASGAPSRDRLKRTRRFLARRRTGPVPTWLRVLRWAWTGWPFVPTWSWSRSPVAKESASARLAVLRATADFRGRSD